MSAETSIENLEAALLERAQRLADEALSLAHENRDRIIREENERLKLREEREVLLAKSQAERNYRRRVQASELKVQEQLDRLRWSLTQASVERVLDALRALADDERSYIPVLQHLLREAVSAIGDPEVIAEINARDHERLRDWEGFCRDAVPGKKVLLSERRNQAIGGVRVHSLDDSVQVDNTFEGRIERFERRLHEILIERLFGKAMEMEELVHG